MNLSSYRTLAFDCDGVVLNSNHVKTRAFYEAALPYGESAAQALVDYHKANGGISRYRKFAYFVDELIPPDAQGPALEELLQRFARTVRELLGQCEIAEGLLELREATPNARWLLVSGGDQAELQDVFTGRGLAGLFDGGIFGSPDTKDEILAREKEKGNTPAPGLFIGDSRYDYEASNRAGLDFLFLSQWSEFAGFRDYFSFRTVWMAQRLGDVLEGQVSTSVSVLD